MNSGFFTSSRHTSGPIRIYLSCSSFTILSAFVEMTVCIPPTLLHTSQLVSKINSTFILKNYLFLVFCYYFFFTPAFSVDLTEVLFVTVLEFAFDVLTAPTTASWVSFLVSFFSIVFVFLGGLAFAGCFSEAFNGFFFRDFAGGAILAIFLASFSISTACFSMIISFSI